jgi:hypothetical protein
LIAGRGVVLITVESSLPDANSAITDTTRQHHSPFDDFVERLKRTPPSCLCNCLAEPAELPEHWDDNPKSVWQIKCRCGGVKGRLLGYSLNDYNPEYDGPLLLVSPLAFECMPCKARTAFLDADIHGYHADIDRRAGIQGGSCKIRGSGEPTSFRCPECANDLFTLTTAFVFWNADELAEEFEDRWEDLFNVFLCYASCCQCGGISKPTEFGKL